MDEKKPNSSLSSLSPVYTFNGVRLFAPFQTNASIMWEVSSNLGDSPKTGMNSF